MRNTAGVDRMVEQTRAMLSGAIRQAESEPGDWLDPGHRLGDTIRMIREGRPDEEIGRKYPGMCGEVLEVCKKIATGQLCELKPMETTEKQAKKARKREKERRAAYRRKYARDDC